MQQIWFIGDTHFGHKNILKYSVETRGHFKTIEEHNEFMVDIINAHVKKNDILFHLGDVAFGVQNLKYIRYLNCDNIRLIMGNHDTYNIMDYVAVGFQKIYGMVAYKEFILTHAPVHKKQIEYRYKYNIHGHLHLGNIDDYRYYNVNADVINLIPKTLEQIRTEIKLRELTDKNG